MHLPSWWGSMLRHSHRLGLFTNIHFSKLCLSHSLQIIQPNCPAVSLWNTKSLPRVITKAAPIAKSLSNSSLPWKWSHMCVPTCPSVCLPIFPRGEENPKFDFWKYNDVCLLGWVGEKEKDKAPVRRGALGSCSLNKAETEKVKCFLKTSLLHCVLWTPFNWNQQKMSEFPLWCNSTLYFLKRV